MRSKKAKRFKVKIMTLEQSGQELSKAWKKTQQGKRHEKGYGLVLIFPDLESIAKVLSPRRFRLIQTIRDQKPTSIRQLAIHLERTQKSVQRDVLELAEIGIIELKLMRAKGKKRESLQPEFNWDGFDIAV
jgi:predicted transcriptional regulator